MTTLKDVVYGAAVGDALGVPYEFLARGTFTCTGMASGGTHQQSSGTFSDDSSMILATCDSIKRKQGRIDCGDMRKRFCDWAYKGAYAVDRVVFDIGNTVVTALAEGEGRSSERSNGNGSLMRIAPLAFINVTDDEIRAASAITHAHRLSMDVCVAYIEVLRKLIAGVSIEEAVVDVHVEVADYTFVSDIARDDVKSGGYVLDTFDAALWCLANTEDYASCVLAAVNLGGDTDTTACVAGALAGAAYGMDAIPDEWLAALRGKPLIDACLF